MSAIKTLYVLYKAVTGDLKQGNDEVLKSNEKVAKSLKSTADLTENFVNKVRGLAKEIAVASGLVYSASELISDFKDAVNFGRDLSVTSNLLNINAEELQAWGNVLQHVGGDAKSFENNVKALGSYFNIRADSAIKILPQLADAFHKLNPQQASLLGQQYGLSPDFILLLQKGRQEVSRMLEDQKKFGLATQSQIDNFGKLNDKIINTGNATRGLFLALANDSLPSLNTTFDAITGSLIFLRNHLKDVEAGLTAIAVGIGATLGIINPALGALAAALLAVIGAYKAYKEISSTAAEGAANPISGGSAFFASPAQLLFGNNAIKLFDNDVNQPIATQPTNNVRNNNNTSTYTQNVNIASVNTNQDAKGFFNQLNNQGNFSNKFKTSQAQNQVSSGVQI